MILYQTYLEVSLSVDRLQVVFDPELSQLGSTTSGAWEVSTILNNAPHDLKHTSTPAHRPMNKFEGVGTTDFKDISMEI